MILSDDDRAQIRARAEAATPGPWEAEGRMVWRSSLIEELPIVNTDGCESNEIAEHIAGMDPPTTLALLDERDNLATRVERVAAVEALAEERDVLYPKRFAFAAHENYVAGYKAARADLRAALRGETR